MRQENSVILLGLTGSKWKRQDLNTNLPGSQSPLALAYHTAFLLNEKSKFLYVNQNQI